MKLYEKYLKVDEKASKKDAMEKVIKTIRSSKTEDQLEMATKMAVRL